MKTFIKRFYIVSIVILYFVLCLASVVLPCIMIAGLFTNTIPLIIGGIIVIPIEWCAVWITSGIIDVNSGEAKEFTMKELVRRIKIIFSIWGIILNVLLMISGLCVFFTYQMFVWWYILTLVIGIPFCVTLIWTLGSYIAKQIELKEQLPIAEWEESSAVGGENA